MKKENFSRKSNQICQQLQSYLEKKCLLNKFQFGFRRNHSSQLFVTYFTDRILKAADQGNLSGALFIDLRKTFDTLPQCYNIRFCLNEDMNVAVVIAI